MTESWHELAALCYAAAALVGWRSTRAARRARAVPWLLGVGAALHAVAFVALHAQPEPPPLESFPTALSLIGWLIAISSLLSLRFADVRGVVTWVAAAAAGFTALASVVLLVGPVRPPGPGSIGPWSHAHVLLSAFGFSFLALASLAGLGYLAKERALKLKNASARALPSLESLDRLEHFALSLGFPLLTLGVLTGFVWGNQQGLSPWTGHSYWLLAAWTVYLLPIGLRVLRREHGEKPARTCVLGFLLLAFSYIGIRLIGAMA
jgi:ABC-type uncharacterized transport system permease subunit